MRFIPVPAVVVVALIGVAADAAAQDQGQAFGIGARLSMVRTDAAAEASAVRFTGGQIRAFLSKRTAVEVSIDMRSQDSEDLSARVRDVPLQASLLLFPIRSTFSPFVLGGVGWYAHRVEQLSAKDVIDSETTRRFGTHAGFGAELRLGRHAGLHGDYRYTFLDFGSDDKVTSGTIAGAIGKPATSTIPGARFLPSYEGSMLTAGLTVYF